MSKAIENEKDVAKVEQEAKVTSNEKPAYTGKYAKFANVAENKLRSNSEFGKMASEDLNVALSDANLATGSNPSAKYLVQHIGDEVGVDLYSQLISKLAPDEEFIGQGKGAEYGLVNGLAVNKLDNTKFIPQARNDMGNYTYWDTIDLSANPSDFDKVEVSIATYLYVQYYINGELDKLVAIIRPKLKQAFVRRQAYVMLQLIQQMFRVIMAKSSSTTASPTNHLSGTTTLAQVDAVKEFLDFIYPMAFDNVQFNYGTDTISGGVVTNTAFTDAYNSCPEEDRVYICEFQTYNNLKKYATTFLSQETVNDYFKMDKWVVLPSSIYKNDTLSASTKGSITQLNTLSTLVGTPAVETRTSGAVMVIDRRAFKRVYNYAKEISEYYAPNDTTQLFAFKNWAIKFLKWGQVAVYNNAALESAFVVPTNEVAYSYC